MASLRKIKNRWYVRISYSGKQKLISTKAKNKRDAEIHLRSWQLNEQQVKLGIAESLIDTNLTINDCIKYFKKNYQSEKGITNSTLKTYNLALNDFQECFSYLNNINELNKSSYPELVYYLQEGYSKVTTNIRLRSIKLFLNYLLESEKIKKIPFKIRQIKIDQAPPKFILPHELDSIYSLVKNKKLLASFKTLESTGMRVGELKNSFRENNFIKLTKTKARRERIIPIADKDIENYDIARNEPYSTSWITRNFTKYAKQVCKGKITAHSLRHTACYRMILEVNNIIAVRDILGHSSIKTTEIYANIPRDYLKQIFNKTIINPEINSNYANA